MASTPVHIRSEPVSQDQNIVVRPNGVRLKDGETIEFRNFMSQDATIKFYKLDAKGTVGAQPESDFCAAGMQGPMLVIPKKNGQPGIKECKTTTKGDFAYSVEAADHNTLDPVIIIDPYDDYDLVGREDPPLSTPVLAVLVVVVAALAYFIGLRRGKKAS